MDKGREGKNRNPEGRRLSLFLIFRLYFIFFLKSIRTIFVSNFERDFKIRYRIFIILLSEDFNFVKKTRERENKFNPIRKLFLEREKIEKKDDNHVTR